MIDALVKFFADYLKNKPITDTLLIVLIGQALWVEYQRKQTVEKAHDMTHSVMKEIRADSLEAQKATREEAKENADRLVSALTGIKREQEKTTAEVKKIPEAAVTAAAKVVEEKASDK